MANVIAEQLAAGETAIMGVMVESNINEGKTDSKIIKYIYMLTNIS